MKKTLLTTLGALSALSIALPALADLAPIDPMGADLYLQAQEPALPIVLILVLVAVLTVGLTLALEFPWYFFGLGKTVRPLRRVGAWLAANAVTLPIMLIWAFRSFDRGESGFLDLVVVELIITLLEILMIGTITKSVSWVRTSWVALAANLTSAVIGTSLFMWLLTVLLYSNY